MHADAYTIEVHIIQANGLKHMNIVGDAPYCVCQVVSAHRSTKTMKCSTKTVKNTLDPVWNEVFKLAPWHPGEPIEFMIYNKGLFGSKTEGKVTLRSEDFFPYGVQGALRIEGLENASLCISVGIMGGLAADETITLGQTTQYDDVPDMTALDETQAPFYTEPPPQRLQVSVMQAVGLAHLNRFTQDKLFVRCSVQHVDKHEKHAPAAFNTKMVSGNLNPLWAETHFLDPWHVGEPIQFAIGDRGLISTRSEGVVTLPSDNFYPNGFEGALPINGHPQSSLYVKVAPAGESAVDQQLEVTVIQANNLRHLNHFTGDSPFVTVQVRRSKGHATAAKFSTKPLNHGANPLDPVWNEVQMLGPWSWGDSVEFAIYDKGMLGSRSEGKVELPADMFYPMGFEGTLPIAGTQASITVRIIPAGPLAPRHAAFSPAQVPVASMRYMASPTYSIGQVVAPSSQTSFVPRASMATYIPPSTNSTSMSMPMQTAVVTQPSSFRATTPVPIQASFVSSPPGSAQSFPTISTTMLPSRPSVVPSPVASARSLVTTLR